MINCCQDIFWIHNNTWTAAASICSDKHVKWHCFKNVWHDIHQTFCLKKSIHVANLIFLIMQTSLKHYHTRPKSKKKTYMQEKKYTFSWNKYIFIYILLKFTLQKNWSKISGNLPATNSTLKTNAFRLLIGRFSVNNNHFNTIVFIF